MKIGYPCINRTLACQGNRTFRLKSYSVSRLIETVQNNLDCLLDILAYNAHHAILFFRVSSDLIPFASHPICTFDWQTCFKKQFQQIGKFITRHHLRISMHPDQFTLINSKDENIFERSVRELRYHAHVLDAMGLDTSAKIQIHVGGTYGDKQASIERFLARYDSLDNSIKRRLVIENDDVRYTLAECLLISSKTGIPVLFDVFHHAINCSGESVSEALRMASATWKKKDGIPMVDYSSQKKGVRRGTHAETIDVRDFKKFLAETRWFDMDIMLEIKDKEKSALKAIQAVLHDRRFSKNQFSYPVNST
jgi:UV DNA damage endonuclease